MARRKKDREPAPAANSDWFRDRARDVGSSLAEISTKLTGHKDLLGRSLGDGSRTVRDLRPGEIAALAQALRVPVVFLFHQLGYRAPFSRVALAGAVNARGQIELFADDRRRAVPAPSEIDLDLSALSVSADAGLPYAGATLYFVPPARVELGAFDRLSVVTLAGDGQFAAVLRRPASGAGPMRLEPIGAKAKPFDAEVSKAAPVAWLHFG